MGTNGLWSYRWRRPYYTTYNHWDSYPEGLGNELVAKIPSDPDEFARWADALKRELDARDDGELESPHHRRNGIGIEWTYVIDFDRNAFTIDGRVNIRLDKLPRQGEDWSPFFDRNHPASLDLCNPIEPSAEHIALYDASHCGDETG
ncbi:hypothetical protein EXIGLDRAFT_728578 [Exidia glandulosa HHB12029]|uniref:Uncharacterized protein n=1 Tax=Exidia glandulosa HHB12029 TaxID=1314781 RepID=A0A165Q3Z9_EXIGL|nr:hypothetical protein EXIGLDRAFT_728578 [Exidia glandulosa HHB12029]